MPNKPILIGGALVLAAAGLAGSWACRTDASAWAISWGRLPRRSLSTSAWARRTCASAPARASW